MINYEWLENYRTEGMFGLVSIEHKVENTNERHKKYSDFRRQKTKGISTPKLASARGASDKQ